MRTTALLLVVLGLTACGPRLIPGTEIQDTEDTRAMLQLMERYRKALENKDIKTLVSLLAPTFRDEGGTPDPDDDLDYAHVQAQLTQRFARLEDVRVDIDVRKLDVDKDQGRIIYYYTLSFRPKATGAHGERESDLKQMTLVKLGKDWKITTGI